LACPADSHISALGEIQQDAIFQAKGMEYSLTQLVGDDPALAKTFENGHFATLYLSPRDYHRIHMPLAGSLQQMRHIPGRLFSVNQATARTLPRLFSRNERLLCLFDTEVGPMAVILVGAIFVGSMDTVWAGTVAPCDRRVSRWHYGDQAQAPVTLAKGEELGRFNMGSTVILLFGKEAIQWLPELTAGDGVQVNQALGKVQG
jgi:phosphatidylserine decarboxylase